MSHRHRPSGGTHVFAGNGVDDIVWGSAEKLGDDRELVDVILAREEGLALEHLGEDAAGTPDIDLDVVLLPGEHDFGGAVVTSRDIASHLRILDTRKAEIANLQVAVLVDQDVAGLQVTVDDTGGVDVFEAALDLELVNAVVFVRSWVTYHDLVQEVLDELLLKRPRSEKSVKIGSEKLGNEVDILERGDEDIAQRDDLHRNMLVA